MKKIIILLFSIFVYGAQPCLMAETSGRLEDVVVRGKDAVKLDSEKTPAQLNIDHAKVIQPSLETDKEFLEKVNPKINKMKETSFDVLSTAGTVSPWLDYIARDPVTFFQFDEQSKLKIRTWELVVTDSRGYKFRLFTGKDSIPAVIRFSGRNEDGNFMRVGNIYGYILTYLDEGGTKKTVIGKPFIIDAALHQEKEGLLISIASKALFEQEDPANITQTGKLILSEASDILKEYFNVPAVVKVYAESESLASEQAREIVKYVSKVLIIPEDKIGIKGYKDLPENYHADILIMNKK